MAILRTKEIRDMTPHEREDELVKIRGELIRERALASRTGAKIKTIQHELKEI